MPEEIGGAGSQRVGGVHIDVSLRGQEKAKHDLRQVGEEAKKAGENVSSGMDQASTSTDRASESFNKGEKAADGFSKNGLAGMLLKLAALRKAMLLASEVLETLRTSLKSGGDAASKIFSEQGLAGAESRMRSIAEYSERSGSALGNASDILKSIATLDVSKIVSLFTEPAKLIEEQHRLSILAGKELRAAHEKALELSRQRIQEERDAVAYQILMEKVAQDEAQRKREEDDAEQLRREKNAEAEALEAARERGREMAKAFAEEFERRMQNISEKINGGQFGIGSFSGGMGQLNEVLGQISRNTSRIQRP